MANTLKSVRAEIATLKAEVSAVESALRPVDELKNSLHAHINSLAAPYDEFISRAAHTVAFGYPVGTVFNDIPPSRLPVHLMGIVLASYGVDALVEQAMQKAAELDPGNLRMTVDERDERLHDLRCRLYALELDEESMLNGEPRRPGANPACVLGIPLAEALAIDERKGNNNLLSGKW